MTALSPFGSIVSQWQILFEVVNPTYVLANNLDVAHLAGEVALLAKLERKQPPNRDSTLCRDLNTHLVYEAQNGTENDVKRQYHDRRHHAQVQPKQADTSQRHYYEH